MIAGQVAVLTLAIAASLTSVATALPACAQDHASRPTTLVVPFAPGGSIDIVGRMLGEQLGPRLSRTFVIENRPGGGTNVATAAVSRAAPNGQTLLITTSSFAINATLYKVLAYDPVKDFVPVALVAHIPLVLVVHPSLPVRSAGDLVALAKESPGRLSYASGGTGSAPHLLGELFKSMAGIEMTHVPYRGGSQAVTDLLAGHVQVMFADPGSVLPQVEQGRVRALGVTSSTRVPAFPDIPPIALTGVSGYDAVSWQLVVAPAKTPAETVSQLHHAINNITAHADIKTRLAKLGLTPVTSPAPEALRRFVTQEVDRWGRVVRDIGLAGSE